MEFHQSLAESPDLEEACDAVVSELRRRLGDAPLDLVVVFASAAYGAALERLPVLLHERLPIGTLIGGTGAELLHPNGMSRVPGIAVLGGRMPTGEAAATAVANADLPHADAPPAAWRALLPRTSQPVRGMVVIGEPFDCDMRALLAGLDFVLPDAPKVGGLAAGSRHPHGNLLFCGRRALSSGAVLLSLSGDLTVRAVVSQGCRPIGGPGRITRADRNRLVHVDDKPARRFVEEQLAALPQPELVHVEGNPLFLGIASDPWQTAAPGAGDFLVRNVLGIDGEGRLVVGEDLSVGRTVQLHVRDGSCGLEDLSLRLTLGDAAAADAALMFRCVGREGADHACFSANAPDVPWIGCTCNGELGPVGATTHLHGYTASCLLLREGR
ncbi:MAG: FIST C-terminal domain-containing protein [Planctomycetes bacterium]|nr:FIST C-terminal domain-containing protein [Planctomycetota bacterium]